VQQRLVSLTLDVRAAQSALPPAAAEVRAELSRVCEGLTATLDELREVARGIHPEVLSRRGLGPALKTLARRSPIRVALDFDVGEELPDGVEVAAYYAVSEMLTNTVKHAQASAINIDVTCVDGILHVAVRDDGIGGADPARGSGLVGLRDRIEALGGTIFLRSPKRDGTVVEITLPLVDDRQAGDNLHGAPLAGASGEAP
jgi:signal transduction histidine kinase